MQIDFHHGVTYVVSRWAGLSHEDSETVAYCAQYVDDATNQGTIEFDVGAKYRRLSSAHKMLDHRNLKELANHLVWIPFHFLPGNGGLPASENPIGSDVSFIEKLICRPNSHPAKDMVRECILGKDKPYGLHRLGVTAHVFVDTWAHQGFAGVNHGVNDVDKLIGPTGIPDQNFMDKMKDFFSGFIRPAIPLLGHGRALTYPDWPFLTWSYTNGLGEIVTRDNTTEFVEAADELCQVIRKYREGDPDIEVSGLTAAQLRQLREKFTSIQDDDGDDRHRIWLDAIGAGEFGFEAVELEYIPKGAGSWKHKALGTREAVDKGDEKFVFSPEFLKSDWKMFHDAAKAHRLCVIDDILPAYGICAA